jgi:diguanylate cyclase (GGDEF)-like protein
LWLLDGMPFFFAMWGQYVGSVIAYEASALVVDQTSELRAQTTALEQQAMHDVTHDRLTDLPNRVLLRDRLEQALNVAQHDRTRLAVLMMDLDRFKEINDTLGHYNGDRLLKQVAARLEGMIQDTATVARLGGDEFAIMLTKLDSVREATKTAQKIGKALQTPFALEGLKLDVQASIGIAVFPEHGPDADTLLQRADVAMYMAKQEKSGFVLYDPKHDKHSPHRLTLMGELRHAIETDELMLHYQPKVNIKSAQLTDVEALVRWQHPQHDLMSPDEFIPLAERTGLIKPLTMWVLNRAMQQHSSWKKAGLDIGIAVNVSAYGLLDLELPDLIAGLLASHGVAPERLMLEITETSIMVDQERALQILTRLNPKHEMIVRATVDLAHNLGLEVIGEGTRSHEIYLQLEKLGSDAAQGEYISRPLSTEDFAHWIKEASWEVRTRPPEQPTPVQAIEKKPEAPKPDKRSIETTIKELEDFIGKVDLRADLSKSKPKKPKPRKRAGRSGV